MLVTLNEIMKIAEEREIAIGSFNTPNLESLEAIIRAAEELDLPVIIQFAQCHEPWIPLSLIGPIMVEAAKKAAVPVCVHLDHGETLKYLQQALDIGFTGIMYDGSTLSYEENLANTKQAVAMAKKKRSMRRSRVYPSMRIWSRNIQSSRMRKHPAGFWYCPILREQRHPIWIPAQKERSSDLPQPRRQLIFTGAAWKVLSMKCI